MDTVKGTALGLGVVGLVLGGVIGYAVAESSDDEVTTTTNNNSDNSADGVTQETSDLRNDLNAEMREHVTLASSSLTTAFDEGLEADKTAAALAELDKNSVAIADLVGSVFPDSRDDFLSLWRNHIGFFADYTVAAKAGDQEAMDKAQLDLAGYGEDASQFFGNNLDDLTPEQVKPLLVEHRDLVIDAVNAYGAGNYDEFYAAEAAAYNQIGTVADALSGAIGNQFLLTN